MRAADVCHSSVVHGHVGVAEVAFDGDQLDGVPGEQGRQAWWAGEARKPSTSEAAAAASEAFWLAHPDVDGDDSSQTGSSFQVNAPIFASLGRSIYT